MIQLKCLVLVVGMVGQRVDGSSQRIDADHPLVGHHQLETTTAPPLPFKYAFAASRVPGGSPDRYVEQEGDGEGVIRGQYTYLDPNHRWQKVSYMADKDGFHIDTSETSPPQQDTEAVKEEKAKHNFLYQQIALRDSKVPVPIISVENVESAAVYAKRQEFEEQYAAIAAEHARIAEEHARLAVEEEKEALQREQARRRREGLIAAAGYSKYYY